MNETAPDEDVLAVDCSVAFPEGDLRVQVKCTSQWRIRGNSLSFPVEHKWVRKWSMNFFPVYFVVVLVTDLPSTWLRHDADGTFHATGAFWTRLEATEIDTAVNVPKSQRLSVDSFNQWHGDLLACLSPGGQP